MNGKVLIGLAAAFGGISPNLLKLALGLMGNTDVGFGWGYALGLMLFGLIGGATALVWGEDIPKRAYFLGLGLPGLVHAGVAGATAQPRTAALEPPPAVSAPSPTQDRTAALSLFASPAWAQPPQPQPVAPVMGRELVIKLPAAQQTLRRRLVLQLDDIPAGAELIFASEKGWRLERIVLDKTDDDERVIFQIPDFATHAKLRIGDAETERLQLDAEPGSTSGYEIDADTPFWSDFLQALGSQNVTYRFKVEQIGARKM